MAQPTLRLFTAALAFAGVCASASRQDDQAAGKIRATTRLVEFTVIAEDSKGEPVTDLAAEDFTVLDKKKAEKIAVFSVEKSSAGRGALPPNTFSNRFEEGAPAGATVILFDGLNTAYVDQVYARGQIIKFVEQLAPDDPVGVYVMGRGPRVLKEVGRDNASLVAALKDRRGAFQRSLAVPLFDAGGPGGQFDAWAGELSFNLVDYFDRDRAFRTVRALTAIAQHLERLPGRKNLVWVSGSFPVSMQGGSIPALVRAARGAHSGWPETDRLVRALNHAKVAVYPVDARGLMAPDDFDPSRANAPRTNHLGDYANFGVMRTLAERTGGRAVYQNNDLAAACKKAIADARHAYVIGFYPSHDEWNSRFRPVTIQVSRPGVKLHYRQGYFALPDEPVESWYREEMLDASMYNPVDASGLGIRASAHPGADGNLSLDVALDTRGITFNTREGGWLASVDIWLVQLDATEHQIKTDAHTTALRLLPLDYERIMKAQGLRFAESVKVANNAVLLRLMVRDVASGTFGSLTIPLRPMTNTAADQ